MKPMLRALLIALLTWALVPLAQSGGGPATPRPAVSDADARRLAQLETLVEGLRQELKIPALSAAVVRNQKVIWARGSAWPTWRTRFRRPSTPRTTSPR